MEITGRIIGKSFIETYKKMTKILSDPYCSVCGKDFMTLEGVMSESDHKCGIKETKLFKLLENEE